MSIKKKGIRMLVVGIILIPFAFFFCVVAVYNFYTADNPGLALVEAVVALTMFMSGLHFLIGGLGYMEREGICPQSLDMVLEEK